MNEKINFILGEAVGDVVEKIGENMSIVELDLDIIGRVRATVIRFDPIGHPERWHWSGYFEKLPATKTVLVRFHYHNQFPYGEIKRCKVIDWIDETSVSFVFDDPKYGLSRGGAFHYPEISEYGMTDPETGEKIYTWSGGVDPIHKTGNEDE